MLNFFARSGPKIEKIDSLCQGEGKRAWRARVRVIVSRERGAHAACAIPRAAFEALSESRFQAIYCMALTASRFSLSGRAVRIRGRASITNDAVGRGAERSAASPDPVEGLKEQRASCAKSLSSNGRGA
jgi:hypothetical protein